MKIFTDDGTIQNTGYNAHSLAGTDAETILMQTSLLEGIFLI